LFYDRNNHAEHEGHEKSIVSELFLCFMFFMVENLCWVTGEVADHYHE